jgi:hypothetical protein
VCLAAIARNGERIDRRGTLTLGRHVPQHQQLGEPVDEGERRPQLVGDGGDRQDLGVGAAPGLGLGPAGERLKGPVHGRDPPERVGQEHPVGDGVEHRPGLAGRPLCLLEAQGCLQRARELVAGQPEQGFLLAVELVAFGPAQGEQAEEAAPGQQRD